MISNEDNIALMARYPDKYFDWCCIDPPYGLGKRLSDGGGKLKNTPMAALYREKDWDELPTKQYWDEVFRVSKNQIIWGANFFGLMGGYIYWNKDTADGFSNGDGELAYCSGIKSVREVKVRWNGMLQYDMKNKENRIHPTQKPIPLYKWCLDNYAEKGDKILDTHLGSGSIAIACWDYGFDLTACELDKGYFDKAMKRIDDHKAQIRMF